MPVSLAFISYSHENQTSADSLQESLQANGITVWIDHEGLPPGTPNWEKAIELGISQAQAVIYVASPAAKDSDYVRAELYLAKYFKIPVYPFWIEGANWVDAAPSGLALTQHIDARSDNGRAFKRLLKALQTQPEPRTTAPVPTPAEAAPGPATNGSASQPRKPKRGHPVLRAFGATVIMLALIALVTALIVSGTPGELMKYLQSPAATSTTITQRAAPTSTPSQRAAPTITPTIQVSPTSASVAPTSTPVRPANPIAHWTEALSPNPNSHFDTVSGVAMLATNNAWMVGSTWGGNTSDPFHTLVEHWNGSSWGVISSPNPGTYGNSLYGVAALASNNIWAVGDVIEHWNGSSWVAVKNLDTESTYNSLLGITALATDNIWAVGSSTTFNPNEFDRTLIERWNGSSWGVISSPNPGSNSSDLGSVAAVAYDDIWAVGYTGKSTDATGPDNTLIEHWNGASWSVFTSPNPGAYTNYLSGVTALAPNNVWAVGYSRNTADDPDRTLIEHWDGSSWKVVTSANASSGNNSLNAITSLAADNIWAVGTTSHKTLIEHWNGSNWSAVASPSPNPTSNSLTAIAALTADDIWAVGANGNGTLTVHWVSSP